MHSPISRDPNRAMTRSRINRGEGRLWEGWVLPSTTQERVDWNDRESWLNWYNQPAPPQPIPPSPPPPPLSPQRTNNERSSDRRLTLPSIENITWNDEEENTTNQEIPTISRLRDLPYDSWSDEEMTEYIPPPPPSFGYNEITEILRMANPSEMIQILSAPTPKTTANTAKTALTACMNIADEIAEMIPEGKYKELVDKLKVAWDSV